MLVEKKQQFDRDELNILEQHKEIIKKMGRTKIDCSSEEDSDD